MTRPACTFTTILALAATATGAQAQRADPLAQVAALAGEWTGIGEGEPGLSAAHRRARRVQGDHFIMVEGRSVYPKQEKNKSGEVHTSIDFWSYDTARKALVLRQFDSLGFVSTYVQDRAASKDGLVVLTSEHLQNVPAGWKARYTYRFLGPAEHHELFELDADGKGLKTYTFGRFLKDDPK